jgi:hypothetical protein
MQRPILVLVVLLALGLPRGTVAQRVVLGGRGPIATDTLLERILRTPGWVILTRDTTIEPGQTLAGPVLTVGNTVRFAGTIPGDLVLVDANVFVRPQARIAGNVTSIGAGFFRANEAVIEGEFTEYRELIYRVVREDDVVSIIAIRAPSVIDFDGYRGINLPLYDRVNGLSLRTGVSWLMPRIGTWDPSLHLTASYPLERERPGASIEFALRGASIDAAFGAERAIATNDGWIRGDLLNSLSVAMRGDDYRDYFEADRFYAQLGKAWTIGGSDLSARLRVQTEHARSLTASEPWTLFDADSVRSNPLIDDGRIHSVTASFGARSDRSTIAGEATLDIEAAAAALGSDFEFGRFEFSGTAAMSAFANHTLLVEWRGRGPLPGTDSLPRQRWSTLGGRGNLYTFDLAEFRGDRLAYVETEYLVPIPIAEGAPIIGRPALGLVHHAGMAWSHGERRDLAQNVGLRLRLRLVWVLGIVDPADTDRRGLFAGFSFPIRYPWWPDYL